MMASYVTPKKNTAFIFYAGLVSQADTKLFKSAPTLAAGDFKVSIDGGALANLATLPTNTPGSQMVKFSLSSSEMNGDNITVVCSDAAGAEWCDAVFNIQTSARQVDDLAFPTTSGRGIAVDTNNKVPATIAAGDLATDSVTAAALKADAVNKIRDALVIASLSPSINVGELGYTLASGAAFAAAAATDTQTLLSRVTAAVYGFWQNLNVGGPVASSAEATAIQNNTRVVRVVPAAFERPDSGSTAFVIELALYDEVGNMEAPDSAPTLAVVNQSLTSRNANLDSTTMTLVSTGRYRGTYTIDTNHAIEQLIFAFSVIEGGNTRVYMNTGQVVDTTAVDFTSNDRTKLDQILADAAAAVKAIDPNNPLDVSVTGAAKIDWGNIDSPGATVNLSGTTIATAATVTDKAGYSLSGTLTTLDAFWTALKKWLRLMVRKDAAIASDYSAELADMNANTGTGTGGYASTTDSAEARRDNVGTNGAALTDVKLHSTGFDAVLIESVISASAALVNDSGTQLSSINGRQALSLILAAAAAKLSGAEGATLDLKPAGKPSASSRVTATCDTDGNRTPTTVRVPD